METNPKNTFTTKKFTEVQPKQGEKVVHCGHLRKGRHHFFQVQGKLEFIRPDGTKGTASWAVICDDCHKLHPGQPEKVICADGTWIGNTPIIEEILPN